MRVCPALPLPVLRLLPTCPDLPALPCLASGSGGIALEPALPEEAQAALSRLRVGRLEKLWLEFGEVREGSAVPYVSYASMRVQHPTAHRPLPELCCRWSVKGGVRGGDEAHRVGFVRFYMIKEE